MQQIKRKIDNIGQTRTKSRKKANRQSQINFLGKPQQYKKERKTHCKHNRDKINKSRQNPQYREAWEGRVKGNGRKYAGGGIQSGHAQQDLGRASVGQTWEVRKRREARVKESQEGKEVHGKKGYRDVKVSTLAERQQDFGRGITGNEESAGGKGNTGMWNETQAKQ